MADDFSRAVARHGEEAGTGVHDRVVRLRGVGHHERLFEGGQRAEEVGGDAHGSVIGGPVRRRARARDVLGFHVLFGKSAVRGGLAVEVGGSANPHLLGTARGNALRFPVLGRAEDEPPLRDALRHELLRERGLLGLKLEHAVVSADGLGVAAGDAGGREAVDN